MLIKDETIVKRWNKVVENIGLEHYAINKPLSELETYTDYYDSKIITVAWMLKRAKEFYGWYYNNSTIRAGDRYGTPEERKIWLSETARIRAIIAFLERYPIDLIVAQTLETT